MNNEKYRLPKRKDGQKTFDQIIDTAKRLFSDRGFQSVSINEIIKEANIATGTFYQYFDDKEALYIYILKKYRNAIRKSIAEEVKNAHTRYEKERSGLKAYLTFASKDPLSYKIIWESLFVDSNVFKEYYQNFSNDYVKQLTHAVNTGEVNHEIDLETLSYVLMGISNFVGLQVIFKKDLTAEQIDKIVDNVMLILNNGMFN